MIEAIEAYHIYSLGCNRLVPKLNVMRDVV